MSDVKPFCILSALDNSININLEDCQETIVGRNVLFGINDKSVSKEQLFLTANYNTKRILAVYKGKNPTLLNGYILEKGSVHILKHGDIIQLTPNSVRYRVDFGPKIKETPDTPKEAEMASNNTSNITSVTKPKISTCGSWETIDNKKLLIYTSADVIPRKKVAAFDVDGTIIETKSGAKFQKDFKDWKLLYPKVKTKLQSLHNDQYKIVFFTNQMGLSRNYVQVPDFKLKLESIIKSLGIPIQAFVATDKSIYRKPCTGMWEALENCKNSGVDIDKVNSFYVGDAAGRPKGCGHNMKKDHSSADRLFAFNVGIKFLTPEEFFLERPPTKYEMPEFNPAKIAAGEPAALADEQEIIIMVGSPASGKSVYCRNFIVPNGYVYVNRDSLGTWQKCVQMVENALHSKKSVVIDNTNGSVDSRKRYIDIAKKNNISCRCFVMKTSKLHSLHNNKFRLLVDKKHAVVGDPIILSYFKNFHPPTVEEGFQEIVDIDFVPAFKNSDDEKLYKSYLLEQ